MVETGQLLAVLNTQDPAHPRLQAPHYASGKLSGKLGTITTDTGITGDSNIQSRDNGDDGIHRCSDTAAYEEAAKRVSESGDGRM